ncbi:hypothetical protein PR202_gb23770 [Eleusine coracana subsp. coracana]|uniref:F-box associated beta-propeller type 3 domain-containing protein n=1 Tax=Eleusine coracana subsp. coracana TaxID=191504 RepID=A0AAV5FJG4_ELECO|nr:hypothetical protein PR202_gb23770 [Eleusine coracana subsp. coracana]
MGGGDGRREAAPDGSSSSASCGALSSPTEVSYARTLSAQPPGGNKIRLSSLPQSPLTAVSSLWKQSASNQASPLLHAEDLSCKILRLYPFAHCDGLVLTPTETKVYLINHRNRNNLRDAARSCHCAGLGLDPSTGKYKVVQPFYRYTTNTVRGTYEEMGIEVFTVNGGVWREIDEDLPYPISKRQTGVTVNGCLFWRVDKAYCHSSLMHLPVLVRFNLADESFGAIMLPDSLDVDKSFSLDMLHGELWLSSRTSDEAVSIWSTSVDDGSLGVLDEGRWERRYSIPLACVCHPIALLPGGQLILWYHNVLYEYDLETAQLTTVCEMDRIKYKGRRARTWKNLWSFNVLPYTESLLRITA